jgi:hypothetical protein
MINKEREDMAYSVLDMKLTQVLVATVKLNLGKKML